MILCSLEEFKKIVNLMETALVYKGNYWVITRSGKEYTLHVDGVVNDMVIARITKVQRIKGLIKGFKNESEKDEDVSIEDVVKRDCKSYFICLCDLDWRPIHCKGCKQYRKNK